jgi:hypothetical protein
MASVNSQMNNYLKFLQMLMSGELSTAMGTYDPIAVAQEQIDEEPSAPLSEAYMSSDDENIKRVFSGLISGQLDPITAKAELLSTFEGQPELATSLGSAVDSVIREQADVRKQAKNANKSKGYLPKVTERYADNPSLAPLLPKAQKAVTGIDKRLAMLENLVPQTKRGTISGPAKQQATNFGSISPEVAKQVASLDPQAKEMLFGEIAKMVAAEKAKRAKVVSQNVSTLEKAGRSPYQDALMKRAAAIAPFFQQ